MLNCTWFPLNPRQGWVYRGWNLDDLKVARAGVPMEVFYCELWDLSGSGCRKAPCCWHAHLMACLPSLLLAPAYTKHRGMSSCCSRLHGSRCTGWCQSRRAFPPWLVIRGGGDSLLQWGSVCWRLHGKGCPQPQLGLCTQQVSWSVSVGMNDTKHGVILAWCRDVWAGNYPGHPGEVMATVCVMPHTQGRLCQPRARFILSHPWLGNLMLTS